MLKQNADCRIEHLGKGRGLTCAWLHRFGRDEGGSMSMFAVFMFICMLMVAGIGIDLMRYERNRATLQNTLDRAVLAAADLDQTRDANAVVTDYFSKAGIAQYLTNVSVDEGLGYKTVSASAQSTLGTYFLSLLGINELTAPAVGTAEERIGNVEISLVLDVSGSMDWNSRMARMKPAAIEFVDAILDSASANAASISVIPYAMQVNAGKPILDEYTTTAEHDYSHCVNFNDDQFSKSGLSQTEILELTAHFDPFTWDDGGVYRTVCPTYGYSQILPFTNDKTELHTYINALQAWGGTSIDIGMKWGTVLLDPSTRPVVNALINKGEVEAKFANRPVDYGSSETLKIIVLMTDGENSDQYMLNPSMRDGLSDVWYKPITGDTNLNGIKDSGEAEFDAAHYSAMLSNGTTTEYWWPDNEFNDWYDHPYGNGTHQECNILGNCVLREEPGSAVQLTFPELFNMTSLANNADFIHSYQGNRWSVWYSNAYTKKEASAKDQRTNHICDAAKDQGVVVFTIGFEAPRSGQRLLSRCASSPSHHFDVNGLDIADAFDSIAASITKLRLIQ
ncbi:TadE/TadG family type IV pilus assembly protein [Thalassovita aquimarina]|uniref:Pilus assembly protein n=1 Tax=Thalassovita aquimarina TaxID=2785917 RepID=A0ABS5HRK4_9RHOB|nr:TadE/TadG family type IV pilus assembly protein [Thalassovita aquimarina]MBR9651619.1 pilus assembly protein [Thalassovita aquimarina]